MRQIGVSIPPDVENKLLKVAKIRGCSLSGLMAEAVAVYLDRCIAEIKESTEPKKSIFTGLTKNESIQQIQKSA